MPAGSKVCGFLSYVVNLGCSRCYKKFGAGVFGKHNYSGFDRESWTYRTKEKHRADVELTRKCSTETAQQRKESELGSRYSGLLLLPYFDVVRMLIIDTMYHLYLGTAKNTFALWRNKGIISDVDVRISNDRCLNSMYHRMSVFHVYHRQ